jgi:hypothetical protein
MRAAMAEFLREQDVGPPLTAAAQAVRGGASFTGRRNLTMQMN